GPGYLTSNINVYNINFPKELINKYGITDVGLRLLSFIINPKIKVNKDYLTLNI
ncbi:hypothetical protein BR93DRAFT_886549, partial [Coniochaeta sp. PMI_546]